MHPQRPRKRFAQHFLQDPGVIDRIIAAIAPAPGQCLIEIGPGRGALTLPLLHAVGELHVIEIDRDLATALERRCREFGRLHVYCQDALDFDFAGFSAGHEHLRVVGNLPYNISTPLLFHLLDATDRIKDMVFMLQEEVVDRMCAAPGNKTYGRLTVMVQARCLVEKLFSVTADSFTPPPQVASAIIRLVPGNTTAVMDWNILADIVRRCFSQRRKTLHNVLKGRVDDQHMENLGIDPGLRPEQLTVAQFVRLANEVEREK